MTDIIKKNKKKKKTLRDNREIRRKRGKVWVHPKDQTPLLTLSGTRKVSRTPTTLVEGAATVEVHVPKDITDRRIQDISREQRQHLSLNFFPGGYRRKRRLSVTLCCCNLFIDISHNRRVMDSTVFVMVLDP